MRHRSNITKFSRDTKSRKALFKSLVRALVEEGKIVTTQAKAREAKRIADKLIGKAKDNSTATRRVLHRFFGVRDVVNTLVDKIAPGFSDRNSGFTRITKVGVRRGDNVLMSELSLVTMPENVGTLKNQSAKKPVARKVVPMKTEVKTSAKKVTTTKKAEPVKKKAPAKKAAKKETK